MRKIYKDNKLIEVQLSRSEQLYLMKKNIAILKELKNKETLEIMKKNQPDNIEDFKEFLEKIPGMKIELKKPVSVKFK